MLLWCGLLWPKFIQGLFAYNKRCFPLAEEYIKKKTLPTHTSGSLGASMLGVYVTWCVKVPSFLVSIHHFMTEVLPQFVSGPGHLLITTGECVTT